MTTSLRDLLAAPPSPGSGLAGELVHEEPLLRLVRHLPPGGVTRAPVLLVPPLAVPAECYDLREGNSLLRHLLSRGHPVHLASYGPIGFRHRRAGLEEWVDRVLPAAVQHAAADAGQDVHVLGWSLGGTMSLLTLAHDPGLPVRSLTLVATPIDYHRSAMLAPVRAAARLTGGRFVDGAVRTLGGVPAPLVRLGYRATSFQRELTRPLFALTHRDQPDALAQARAIDGFLRAMPGYPGRLFVQVWHRLILGNELARGRVRVGDRDVHLDRVRVPVLAVGSRDDVIAPLAAVAAITEVLTGAPQVRVEVVGGGHLSVLTGNDAPATTWVHLAEFLADVDRGRAGA